MDDRPSPSAVPEFWQRKYRHDAAKNWNLFYKRNENRFFRDRHWVGREFPELLPGCHCCSESPSISTSPAPPASPLLLEVGCGVGNFVLPLLQTNCHIRVCGFDFSERAIEILQRDPRFVADRCEVFVADATTAAGRAVLHQRVGPASVDLVSSIFVLSAVPPELLGGLVDTVAWTMRPGAVWLIRDYAHDDAAQNRFAPDRKLANDLFVRQDGTLARFFTKGMAGGWDVYGTACFIFILSLLGSSCCHAGRQKHWVHVLDAVSP